MFSRKEQETVNLCADVSQIDLLVVQECTLPIISAGMLVLILKCHRSAVLTKALWPLEVLHYGDSQYKQRQRCSCACPEGM
jgi:hypothetical protein